VRVLHGGLDISLDAFDYCALVPIVRNAGGVTGRRSVVASATPALHGTVLGILASTAAPARAAS
jgi:hypothetical protein